MKPLAFENKERLEELETRLAELENANKIVSGEEVATNEYIDGERVYRKRINCGSLPDTDTITVDTGLSGVKFVKYEGFATNSGSWIYRMVQNQITTASIVLQMSGTTINITTYKSSYTNYTGYVDLYYTK